MAKFEGYALTLETVEEVENFVKSFEKALTRNHTEIEKTIALALKFADNVG